MSWREEYSLVSDNDALKIKKPGNPEEQFKTCVQTSQDFLDNKNAPQKMIVFESLQGLKGSLYFGGEHDKLKWLLEEDFDLLIVDESHEGVDTMKTERAFDNIKRKHTLFLSGTPFRQLASARFSSEQIYNWSYADEQEAKLNWHGPEPNPYEKLPRLCLFTYQMSEIIRNKAQKGLILTEGEGADDYAFDLNEFFLTNDRGRFVHEEDVCKFIRALTRQEKYPFSSPELRQELAHTLWYLNRVASAKALKKLLEEDEVFKEYDIILAAGNEQDEDEKKQKAYDRVKDRVTKRDKTITLTVGQLTTGVTIPQWSAVLMLCNLASPAAYMQAAFRAQNPWVKLVSHEEEIDGERVIAGELRLKENAYVFDFDPARTLAIFEEFATNLSPDTAGGGGTGEEREKGLMRLLNFLPVIGEDTEGKMVELDAAQVLTIPRRLKSQEVVRRGFMSNLLFQNIVHIFSAPPEIRKIFEKLPIASEENRRASQESLDKIEELPLDEDGNVDIAQEIAIGQAQGIFGDKIYGLQEQAREGVNTAFAEAGEDELVKIVHELGKDLKNRVFTDIIATVSEAKGLSKSARKKMEKKTADEIDRAIRWIAGDYEQERKAAEALYKREDAEADNETAKVEAKAKRDAAIEAAADKLKEKARETVKKTLEEKPVELYHEAEIALVNDSKRDAFNEMRARLRGFSRTIPTFLMAYGNDNISLSNLEEYVTPEIFKEVTGISLEEFRLLRDGGEFVNERTGQKEVHSYKYLDPLVFDDSIRLFLKKRTELANYFLDDQEEDIFDYIPPQKTYQIYTPRQTVINMVDMLEEENPGCFDDPDKTFADLYMKSGLYIAEIVKRLFRSEGMKKAIPNDDERIRHIIENQVFGAAPTEIIQRIATNYILGFDPELKDINNNFKVLDVIGAAKEGKLAELLEKEFGKK